MASTQQSVGCNHGVDTQPFPGSVYERYARPDGLASQTPDTQAKESDELGSDPTSVHPEEQEPESGDVDFPKDYSQSAVDSSSSHDRHSQDGSHNVAHAMGTPPGTLDFLLDDDEPMQPETPGKGLDNQLDAGGGSSTAVTPALPINPFARNGAPAGGLMNLSQLFQATQAVTPGRPKPLSDPLAERPSPDAYNYRPSSAQGFQSSPNTTRKRHPPRLYGEPSFERLRSLESQGQGELVQKDDSPSSFKLHAFSTRDEAGTTSQNTVSRKRKLGATLEIGGPGHPATAAIERPLLGLGSDEPSESKKGRGTSQDNVISPSASRSSLGSSRGRNKNVSGSGELDGKGDVADVLRVRHVSSSPPSAPSKTQISMVAASRKATYSTTTLEQKSPKGGHLRSQKPNKRRRPTPSDHQRQPDKRDKVLTADEDRPGKVDDPREGELDQPSLVDEGTLPPRSKSFQAATGSALPEPAPLSAVSYSPALPIGCPSSSIGNQDAAKPPSSSTLIASLPLSPQKALREPRLSRANRMTRDKVQVPATSSLSRRDSCNVDLSASGQTEAALPVSTERSHESIGVPRSPEPPTQESFKGGAQGSKRKGKALVSTHEQLAEAETVIPETSPAVGGRSVPEPESSPPLDWSRARGLSEQAPNSAGNSPTSAPGSLRRPGNIPHGANRRENRPSRRGTKRKLVSEDSSPSYSNSGQCQATSEAGNLMSPSVAKVAKVSPTIESSGCRASRTRASGPSTRLRNSRCKLTVRDDDQDEAEIPASFSTRRIANGHFSDDASNAPKANDASLRGRKPTHEQHNGQRRSQETTGVSSTREEAREPAGLGNSSSDPSITHPHRVFALFKANTPGYYPATCLSSLGGRKFLVRFDDGTQDAIEADRVRSLDLRLGDMVKVNQTGLRKNHVVVGFEETGVSEDLEKVSAGNQHYKAFQPYSQTDIRGHSTVILAAKQRASIGDEPPNNIEPVHVPITDLYIVHSNWPRYNDRAYTHMADHPSFISTPYALCRGTSSHSTASRPSRRVAASLGGRMSVATPSLASHKPKSEFFSDMVFAVSYVHDAEKERISKDIRKHGGIVLEHGFDELFDSDTRTSSASSVASSMMEDMQPSLILKPEWARMGFAALIASQHSRREKYLQALALGIPCLAGRWIDDCVQAKEVLNWEPYLLPAGESRFLGDAIRSRTLPYTDPRSARLAETIRQNARLLHGQSVLFVTGNGDDASDGRGKPFLFLTKALGPSRITPVRTNADAKSFLDRAREQDGKGGGGEGVGWDYVCLYSEGNDSRGTTSFEARSSKAAAAAAASETARKGRPRRSNPRRRSARSLEVDGMIKGSQRGFVDYEWLAQSLILGRLLPE